MKTMMLIMGLLFMVSYFISKDDTFLIIANVWLVGSMLVN